MLNMDIIVNRRHFDTIQRRQNCGFKTVINTFDSIIKAFKKFEIHKITIRDTITSFYWNTNF